MKEKKNHSLLVASIFFVIFLVFVVAFKPEVTGNVVLNVNDVDDSLSFGDNVNGDIALNITATDFIPNTSVAKLELIYEKEAIKERTLNITDFFSKTSPTLTSSDLVKKGDEYGFNKTGQYVIDLNKFGLNTKPYYGTLAITLSIEDNGDSIIHKDKEIKIENKSSSIPVIYKFEELGKVDFEVVDGEMVILDTSSNFQTDDYVWCLVRFDNKTLDTLDIYFYSPEGLEESFTDVTNANTDIEDDEVGGICDDNDGTLCGAFYQVKNTNFGTWACKAVANPGNVTIYSTDSFFEKAFTMGNTGPKQTQTIPDLNISKNGSYDTIDLDNYFDSALDNDLEFGVTGLKYISGNFDNSNKLLFSNPNGFEGIENISVRVSDGYNVTESNRFLVRVGSGTVIPQTGCTPSWKSTSWSACVNGNQVRSVVDANSCNVVTGKPLESQVCVDLPSDMTSGEKFKTTFTAGISKSVPINPMVWILLIIGIIAFVGVGIYYLIGKLKNKPIETKINPIETKTVENNQIVQSKPVVQTNTNGVEDYIQKSLEAKVDINIIKQNLLNAGWDQKLIDEKLPFVQAKVYVKAKLAQGVDKDKLKESFLLKGWKEEQVNKLFD